MGRRFYLKVTLPCTATPSGELLVEPGSSEPDHGRQDARHPGELAAHLANCASFQGDPPVDAKEMRPRRPVCSGADGPKRSGGAFDHVDVAVRAAPKPERDLERRGRCGP